MRACLSSLQKHNECQCQLRVQGNKVDTDCWTQETRPGLCERTLEIRTAHDDRCQGSLRSNGREEWKAEGKCAAAMVSGLN